MSIKSDLKFRYLFLFIKSALVIATRASPVCNISARHFQYAQFHFHPLVKIGYWRHLSWTGAGGEKPRRHWWLIQVRNLRFINAKRPKSNLKNGAIIASSPLPRPCFSIPRRVDRSHICEIRVYTISVFIAACCGLFNQTVRAILKAHAWKWLLLLLLLMVLLLCYINPGEYHSYVTINKLFFAITQRTPRGFPSRERTSRYWLVKDPKNVKVSRERV